MKNIVASITAGLALISLTGVIPAQAQTLAGQVTSFQEGAMEGVLVSAKKAGTTITVTVVSDVNGHYSFPAAKLTSRTIRYPHPGDRLRSRTAGQRDDHRQRPTKLDLKLRKTEDLAAQMSNGEWLASFPGTDQQKNAMLGCVGCHTIERIARSTHKADDFINVTLPRMQGYVNQSIPAAPQLRRGERRMEERGDQRVQVYRAAADFLSGINLSAGPQWNYELKTLPRPKGRATRVVITEYDLPRETIQPHDVVIDADGIAWYSSFGEQFLGTPRSQDRRAQGISNPAAQARIPDRLPRAAAGQGRRSLARQHVSGHDRQVRSVRPSNSHSGRLPPEQNIDAAQVNMVSPQFSHVDGKVWAQNNGFAGIHRLDLATGKIETWEPFKDAPKGEPHNVYDVVPDSRNNVFFTDFRQKHIGRIDAKTGEVKLFALLTPSPALRRGQMDAQDRLWVGEYRGDKIAMFDTKTERFTEWPMPTRWTNPYDVAIDKNEDAWTGSMLNDRVVRLDTKTGNTVEYLLPRSTNIRRVHVDNSTTPVTFWVGSNHGASVIKLEPLD